jgi:hypothetical protein
LINAKFLGVLVFCVGSMLSLRVELQFKQMRYKYVIIRNFMGFGVFEGTMETLKKTAISLLTTSIYRNSKHERLEYKPTGLLLYESVRLMLRCWL